MMVEKFEVVWLDKSVLHPLPYNVRKMSDEEMNMLRRSISELGFVDPLQVVKVGEKYIIVNGNHRFKVLKDSFGWERFPCVVIGENMDEEEILAEAIRLNRLSGEFDPLVLRDVLNRVIGKWIKRYDKDTIRERLGFVRKDKIFEKQYAAVTGAKVGLMSSKTMRRKSLMALLSDLGKVLSKEERVGIVYFGERFFVVRFDEEFYEKLEACLDAFDGDFGELFVEFLKEKVLEEGDENGDKGRET